MEEKIVKEHDNLKDTATSSIDSHSMENIMESLVKITLGGMGGAVIGLSLEKRLESMKLITAEGLAVAARRKRGKITTHQSNLVVAWTLSCLAFCTIIETSRLTSPSTWISNQLLDGTENSTNTYNKRPAITIADYSFGGAVAGVTCSFGRRMYSRNSSFVKHRPRTFSGFVSGLTLGVAAGTLQCAIDYGTSVLIE